MTSYYGGKKGLAFLSQELFSLLVCFEIVFCCAVNAALKLFILLSQPSECWACMREPPLLFWEMLRLRSREKLLYQRTRVWFQQPHVATTAASFRRSQHLCLPKAPTLLGIYPHSDTHTHSHSYTCAYIYTFTDIHAHTYTHTHFKVVIFFLL